jgi:hypothetical protein
MSMQINFIYDASVASAPAGFINALKYVAGELGALFTDAITVNINIGWGEIAGRSLPSSELAEGGYVGGPALSYGRLVSELRDNAGSATVQAELASLPGNAASQLGSPLATARAQAKAWGLISPTDAAIDGYVGFSANATYAFDPANQAVPGAYSFIGVAEHEITHALGRLGATGAMALVRYSAPGVLANGRSNGAYFSIDGGKTNLGIFDSNDPGDWLPSNLVGDSFNEVQIAGLGPLLSATDLKLLEAMGFNINGQAATGPVTVTVHGTSAQYVVVNDSGLLYLNDTVPGRDGARLLPADTLIAFTDGTGVFDPTGTAEHIARLYQGLLDHAPDVSGLKFWTNQVDNAHVPLDVIANAIAASPEFIGKYGPLSSAGFIDRLYGNALGRPAGTSDEQFWGGLLSSGVGRGAVAVAISESPESQTRHLATTGDNNGGEIYRLYETAFARVPDLDAASFWSSVLGRGDTIGQVAQAVSGSTEFQAAYGGMSISDFVTAMYRNALHHAPDAAGLQYWSAAIQGGESRASVIVGFSDSLESRLASAAATHANWVFVPT